MDVYVLRHAETDFNVRGLCNDNPNVKVNLTTKGVQQAQAASLLFKNLPIAHIFVSELPRTHQTADIINTHHNVKITVDSRLNDIKTGFDGRPVAQYFGATGTDRYNYAVPGAESVQHYQERVFSFIREISEINERAILVVAHEETLRVFAAYFNRLPPDDMLELHFTNCDFLKFTIE